MVRCFKHCSQRHLVAYMVAIVGFTAALQAARAQTVPARDSTPGSTYTLHAYADLLQVPTLVLTQLHGSYLGLTSQSFSLSLDKGPTFHPTNVRLQGADSITLAILFDLTTDDSSMFDSFAKAMSELPPGVLSARDYISVYAYDCELVRTTEDQPATPEHLQASMQKVMTEGRDKARNGAPQSCWSQKRLYDVIARVTQDIAESPGRRVILVLSDGADRYSVKNNWSNVEQFAGSKSITIFGIRPVAKHAQITLYDPFNPSGPRGWWTMTTLDPFGMMCGSSGGLVLAGGDGTNFMKGQIRRVMTILRDRYILEFPRPVNGRPGLDSIKVTINDPKAIVRPAGVSFPARMTDPEPPEGTLLQDQSKMPVVGSERPDQPK